MNAIYRAILRAELELHLTPPDPDADTHLRILRRALGTTCAVKNCAEASRAKGMCDTHYRRQKYRDERVEDVEFLLDSGEHPANIAARLGYRNAANLSSMLNRWERPDLAQRLRNGEAA